MNRYGFVAMTESQALSHNTMLLKHNKTTTYMKTQLLHNTFGLTIIDLNKREKTNEESN